MNRPRPLRAAAVLAAVALTIGCATAHADPITVQESDGMRFKVTEVARGLDSPWGMAFLPDGAMLVTERGGTLRRVAADGTLRRITGVPEVRTGGQGGLLDVALHPGFARNGLVYLSYSGAGDGGVNTEVARARLEGDALTGLEVIFRAAPKTAGRAHFGSRLVFAPDGLLFVSLGDRYSHMKQAQDPRNHIGTIVRIRDDGGIPADNPFAGGGAGAPEVFSYGHRNVQGLAMRADGRLWAHEHGPRGGDEVNLVQAGLNYGWPAITYGIDYSGATISEFTEAPGMAQPVVFWVPSIAPSGMAFYEADRLPAWRGNLFVGALAGRHLRRLVLDGDRVTAQEVLLADLRERIRDVDVGPDGLIYVLTESGNGRLLRLSPAD